MFEIEKYQKKMELRDGTKITLRPMVKADQKALYEFFQAVPQEEARYLRDDVSKKSVVEKWAENLDYSKTLPILALKGDTVIGDITLNRRRFGWKWHLGTIRIFVHNKFRKVGLGKLMIKEIIEISYHLGLEKLIAEVPTFSTAAINAFENSNFYRAAVLPNMVKDRENRPVDVVVMAKDLKAGYDEGYDYGL